MSRLTKVEPILDIAAWENMLVSSEEKLIVVDCHQDWCGPCEAIKPTIQKIFNDFEEAEERVQFMSACIQTLGEQIQLALPSDSKIHIEKYGCMPLFLLFKSKVCIAHVVGVMAPAIQAHIATNIPPRAQKSSD